MGLQPLFIWDARALPPWATPAPFSILREECVVTSTHISLSQIGFHCGVSISHISRQTQPSDSHGGCLTSPCREDRSLHFYRVHHQLHLITAFTKCLINVETAGPDGREGLTLLGNSRPWVISKGQASGASWSCPSLRGRQDDISQFFKSTHLQAV